MASLKNTIINDTGYIQLPSGTDAQRPTGSNGMIRFNTSSGSVELYNGNTTTWNQITDSTYTAELLLVGGGGGGGGPRNSSNGGGGGGGGGGVLYVASVTITKNTTYSISIGAGGEGGRFNSTINDTAVTNCDATKGGNTTAFGYTAFGGGAGQSYANTAGNLLNGGSGGGGARDTNNTRGTGSTGQGNSGGFGYDTFCGSAGGGGGAGGAGFNGCFDCNSTRSPSTCGNGGVGLAYNWSGTTVYYGGGGGGAYEGSTFAAQQPLGGNGTGSSGGNGAISINGSIYGSPGVMGTGNGGGGGDKSNGYNGGSGIVMIRYSGTPIGEGGTIVYSSGVTTHVFYGTGSYKG
jgi:hypothetical protein